MSKYQKIDQDQTEYGPHLVWCQGCRDVVLQRIYKNHKPDSCYCKYVCKKGHRNRIQNNMCDLKGYRINGDYYDRHDEETDSLDLQEASKFGNKKKAGHL